MVIRRIPFQASTALMLLGAPASACSNSSGPSNNGGGGGGGGLVVSSATPASGNGTLGNVQVVTDTNSAVQQGPAILVTISGSVGGTLHVFNLNILKSDNSLPNIEHVWGADLNNPDGFTLCDAGGIVGSPCDPNQVSADVQARTLTFTGLALTAALNDGDVSTVDGTISY